VTDALIFAGNGRRAGKNPITLLLVPVFYSICVLDLKVVNWEQAAPGDAPQDEPVRELAVAGPQ
jgi:hypothetical protein